MTFNIVARQFLQNLSLSYVVVVYWPLYATWGMNYYYQTLCLVNSVWVRVVLQTSRLRMFVSVDWPAALQSTPPPPPTGLSSLQAGHFPLCTVFPEAALRKRNLLQIWYSKHLKNWHFTFHGIVIAVSLYVPFSQKFANLEDLAEKVYW